MAILLRNMRAFQRGLVVRLTGSKAALLPHASCAMDGIGLRTVNPCE